VAALPVRGHTLRHIAIVALMKRGCDFLFGFITLYCGDKQDSPVMAKKLEGKRTEGWVYVVQWSNDKDVVKIGFSTTLKDRFSTYLTYSRHQLVVLKAFRADQSEESRLHKKFAFIRDNGEWFTLTPALRHYLQEKAPCHTKDAKEEFDADAKDYYQDRIIWKPMQLSPQRRKARAHAEDRLPSSIKTATAFVLWVLNVLEEDNYYTTPNAIITHSYNKNLYGAKTIYNALSVLLKSGVIYRGADKLYYLTDKGRRGIYLLEENGLNRSIARQGARSLKPGAGLD
jgi:hypothetical protein